MKIKIQYTDRERRIVGAVKLTRHIFGKEEPVALFLDVSKDFFGERLSFKEFEELMKERKELIEKYE